MADSTGTGTAMTAVSSAAGAALVVGWSSSAVVPASSSADSKLDVYIRAKNLGGSDLTVRFRAGARPGRRPAGARKEAISSDQAPVEEPRRTLGSKRPELCDPAEEPPICENPIEPRAKRRHVPSARLLEANPEPRGQRPVPTASMIAAKACPAPGLRCYSKISARSWLAGTVVRMMSNDIVRIAYDDGTAAVIEWDGDEHVVEPSHAAAERDSKKRKYADDETYSDDSDDGDDDFDTNSDSEADRRSMSSPTAWREELPVAEKKPGLSIGQREIIALSSILDLRCIEPSPGLARLGFGTSALRGVVTGH